MRATTFAAAMTLAASCAAAQSTEQAQQQPAPPPPACDDAVYRQFDFWAGDWEVFTLDGKKAGDNSITIEEHGCLLVEHWKDMRTGTGQSYNFYDPGMKKWRQVWVSRGATIDYAGGLNDDGEMALEGEIAYRNGRTAKFKGIWTLQENGSVRQHFEEKNAETGKWAEWFTGIYKKKTASAE